jgi:RNA polymerase sigma-70 factor (ECF subfamily)
MPQAGLARGQLDSLGEAELLRRQDPDTWRALFLTEMPAVYRYVASRTRTAAEAEDLTSDVFEAAWKGAHGYQDRGLPPRAWLFGIARNLVNSHRRALFRKPPELELGPETSPGASDEMERVELADAIKRLSRSHAEVIALRFVHQLTLDETAAVLSTTVNAVKGRQARALQALRDVLGAGA